MSPQSDAVPESARDSQLGAPAAVPATRLLYWSVRRELWENHSIYIAPLAVAALAMCGFLVSLWHLPPKMREGLAPLDPQFRPFALAMPYSHAAMLIMLTAFIVGVVYCLDALHGERRDRSILFWKSLPVSDLTTVLSKASIPLVVLPLLVFVIVVAMHLTMLLLSTAVLVMSGGSAARLWAQLPFFQLEFVLLYSLIVIALWYAPIYGWLLLVSAWARRTAFLWAVLPILAIGIVERIAFHTSYVRALMKNRLLGFSADAFSLRMPDGTRIDPHFIPLTQLTPGRFLISPGLWIGLAFAAAFVAAAVRLRRYREPI
jgi:ABC-2 type transport system permease protein